VDPLHLLSALLDVSDNIVPQVLEKAGVSPARLVPSISSALDKVPEGHGNVQLSASPAFRDALDESR
jgi:ATP-dependent Clp protease ATP-binding subunit ClpA